MQELLAFQTRYATTQINLGKGGEKAAQIKPFYLALWFAKAAGKRVAFKRKIRPGKRFSMKQKESHVEWGMGNGEWEMAG